MVLHNISDKKSSRPPIEVLLHRTAKEYNRLAPRYSQLRFGPRWGRYDFQESQALVRDLIRTLFGEHWPNRLALDLACGTGKIAVTMAQLGGTVVALDGASMMLRECMKRAGEEGITGRLLLTNASAGSLPYRDGSFDIVFASRFLHLFPAEAYASLLREMARVVKPGGYIVIEVKNRWHGGLLYWVRDWVRALKGHTTFSSYMTSGTLQSLVRQVSDLTLQSTHGLLLPKGWWVMDCPRLARMARLLAREPLKSISAHLVAVYQKG